MRDAKKAASMAENSVEKKGVGLDAKLVDRKAVHLAWKKADWKGALMGAERVA